MISSNIEIRLVHLLVAIISLRAHLLSHQVQPRHPLPTRQLYQEAQSRDITFTNRYHALSSIDIFDYELSRSLRSYLELPAHSHGVENSTTYDASRRVASRQPPSPALQQLRLDSHDSPSIFSDHVDISSMSEDCSCHICRPIVVLRPMRIIQHTASATLPHLRFGGRSGLSCLNDWTERVL